MKKILMLNFLTVFLVGCSNHSADDLINPPSQSVTYNQNVKTIIDNNCISCHGSSSPSAGVSLTNYNEVKTAVLSNNLIQRMNSSASPMPPSGKLPQPTIDQVQSWKDGGLLE